MLTVIMLELNLTTECLNDDQMSAERLQNLDSVFCHALFPPCILQQFVLVSIYVASNIYMASTKTHNQNIILTH